MLILLALPVIAVVSAVHRYLQCCAPSNLLTRRVRGATPTFRMAAVLLALAAALLVLMHVVAEAIGASGGPGWLNLVVLLLAWDVIKLTLVALVVAARSLAALPQRTGRRIAPRQAAWS